MTKFFAKAYKRNKLRKNPEEAKNSKKNHKKDKLSKMNDYKD